MEANNVETNVLVLTGEAGEMYAIPQDALEQYRVSDEQRAELEEQWGDDVSGYTMYQSYLNEQAMGQRNAEMRQQREAMRHKADYAQMSADAGAGGEETAAKASGEAQGMKRLFTGVLTTLRLAPARTPKQP